MLTTSVTAGARLGVGDPEFGQGFWVERRVFPNRGAHAAGLRGHVKVTAYLALCAYLGEEQGPPQAAVTRISTLSSWLGVGAPLLHEALGQLAAEQWLQLAADSLALGWGREERFSTGRLPDHAPLAFRLLGRRGTDCRQPASDYFRLDRRLLDLVREIGTTGVAAYAYVGRRGSPGRPARFSLELMEPQLGLGEGSGSTIMRRLEERGLIRVVRRSGPGGQGLAACHAYERMPWPDDWTPPGESSMSVLDTRDQ